MKNCLAYTILILLAISSLSADPSLREKVAQMLIIGFHDTEATESSSIIKHVRDNRVGGVLFYGRNVVSPKQIKALTTTIKQAAHDNNLIISVDQEGGLVNRLYPAKGFPLEQPSPTALGAAGDIEKTYNTSNHMGQLLKQYGFNTNFAPAVDLAVSPNNFIAKRQRTFSKHSTQVTNHAAAFVMGMQDAGIITSLKHFPGHGSSTGDTHLGFVDVSKTWSEDELVPYKKFIERGFNQFIMTTHCVNTQIDPTGLPATLSQTTLTGKLRNELGFKGLIITDDLVMGAILKNYSLEEALKLTINAGSNILIVANHEEDITEKAIDAIVKFVESGDIDEALINDSYARILALKASFIVSSPRLSLESQTSQIDFVGTHFY